MDAAGGPGLALLLWTLNSMPRMAESGRRVCAGFLVIAMATSSLGVSKRKRLLRWGGSAVGEWDEALKPHLVTSHLLWTQSLAPGLATGGADHTR